MTEQTGTAAVSAFGEVERARPGDALGLYAGNSNPLLAKRIARYLGIELGSSEVFEFANENIFVRILDNVREKDIFLVQPTCRPVQKSIMELLIMIDAFKRASAGRITAVVPYYAYGRSDKKDQPRVPITARLIADMISVAGADRLLTMDLHQGQIQGFFNIPVDELTAVHLLSNYWRQKDLENMVVVTDLGFAKRARTFAELLGAPLAIIEKRREANDDRARVMNVIGDVRGKRAIIVDDEIDTGGHPDDDLPGTGARRRHRDLRLRHARRPVRPGHRPHPRLQPARGGHHRHHPAVALAPARQGQGALRGAAHRRGHHAHPPRRIGRRTVLRGCPAHPGHAPLGRSRGVGRRASPWAELERHITRTPGSTRHERDHEPVRRSRPGTSGALPGPVAERGRRDDAGQRRLPRPAAHRAAGTRLPCATPRSSKTDPRIAVAAILILAALTLLVLVVGYASGFWELPTGGAASGAVAALELLA